MSRSHSWSKFFQAKSVSRRRRRAGTRPLRLAVAPLEERALLSALGFSTYLGGTQLDEGLGVAVDAAGNTYLTGSTKDVGFAVTTGAFDASYNGGSTFGDAFVAKFDAAGALVWSTYLGGAADDRGLGIALDGAGNVFVTGNTLSSNFPTTAGAFDTSINGAFDTWVAKLDPSGSALLYSTYLGGSGDDFGSGNSKCIVVDASGSAYVTGVTRSSNYPVTSGAFQTSFRGGLDDAVVTKLDPSGAALLYSTYLGGFGSDRGNGITLDASGNAYVIGLTASGNFPLANPLQSGYGGGSFDAFVTKLNVAGSGVLYSTFLGGSGFESGSSIAVNAAGQAYVLTGTTSTNLATTPGAFQPASPGGGDHYVAQLDTSGAARLWATYLGGTGGDNAISLTVDGTGNVYVAGSTTSADFPTANPVQATYAGQLEGTVSMLNSTGTALTFSTYLGGSADEQCFGVALDVGGNPIVTGYTRSLNFPVTAGALDTSFNGESDAIVTKFILNRPPTASADGPYTVAEGGSVTLMGSGSEPDGDALSYGWDLDNNGTFETPGQNVVFSALGRDGPGSQTVVLRVTDSKGASATASTSVSITNVAPANLNVTLSTATITEGGSTMLNGTFTDPGAADTHTVTINWGDGTPTTVLSLVAGVTSFSAVHPYIDDNPSGTSSDSYTITVTLLDDDGARGSPTAEHDSVWVGNHFSSTVSRVSKATNTIAATITTGAGAHGVAVDTASVWVTNPNANTISRLNKATGAVTATIPVGARPHAISVDTDFAWTASFDSNVVSRISKSTNSVIATNTLNAGGLLFGISVDSDSAWVAVRNLDQVARISKATNAVAATIAVGDEPSGVLTRRGLGVGCQPLFRLRLADRQGHERRHRQHTGRRWADRHLGRHRFRLGS